MSQSNQNKKLLILLDKDFVGGAEVNYRYIIPELEKRNYEVFLVLDGEENIKRYYRGFGINATLLPILSPYKPFRNSGKMCYINIAMTYFSLLRNRRILEKVASEYRPKAIISNSMISHWLLALWSNRRSYKASVVTIMHLQDIVDRTKVYGLYGIGLDWITSKVDRIISISDSVTETLPGKCRKKVRKLYNPVINPPLLREKRQNDILRVGMFARYIPWKGHRDLLKIARCCCDRNVEFSCFGNVSDEDTAYYDELQAEVQTFSNRGRVELNRFTPDVLKEMRNCDLILHLSVFPEPFGRILIEANACKVPIFAYKGGAVEELFRELGLAGRMFDSGDWESVARAIFSFGRSEYEFPDLSILNPSIYVDRLLSLIEESQ
jgi:glycosyltransferase involved in cell wall biosynthesis